MVNNIAIKICGINDSETARACKNVDYVGLVFYQKSPRFVTAFQAKEISKFFSKNTKKVGLFVNANIELIEYITEYVNLDFIQLHGDEDLSMIKAIKQRLNKPIIKAISICSEKDVDLSETFKPFCEMILFDTKLQTPEIRGGSGISFNWNLLEKYKSKKKWMLAGGLNIKNLKKAVELTGAPIVDISSGVEVEKGVKCPEKIKELIRYVKKSRFTKI